jgi:hypothetical protein
MKYIFKKLVPNIIDIPKLPKVDGIACSKFDEYKLNPTIIYITTYK